ncbi:DUF262 domain-containing protein [Shewanella mangrovisoli]|uniref:DUF262 domain-containing protein n=1 Tax=Shewanella mangrovisoli TaxID=2864211 RepID=UPI001C65FFEC|nr:DUF262 domain-containing protein [Shewanella mangrovisoli]QYK09789.1 DUF262 domain-containing protein [Shewanella mangrovisoli]
MIEYNDDIEMAETLLEDSEDSSETPPSDIVAFNELRSCADLVRMYEAKQLVIKPDFQRDVVWTAPSQTRFIDSLVKQLPIPSMCLSLDYKTEKRQMIDGLQRISSIIKFLNDDDWRLSNLEDIDARISGKTAEYIKQKHPDIYSRIQNLTIPITVLRCDYSKKSHQNYLFTIFHRLNTGGNKLSNQEIRNCIYSGSFNKLLKEIVSEKDVRLLFNLEEGKSYRFSYEELFLRVFTFTEMINSYNGKLAKFLNTYMSIKRDISDEEYQDKLTKMMMAINIFYHKIQSGRALPKLSKATLEATLVGMYLNIENLILEPEEKLKERFSILRNDSNFSVINLSEGIAATEKVKSRILKGIEIFS